MTTRRSRQLLLVAGGRAAPRLEVVHDNEGEEREVSNLALIHPISPRVGSFSLKSAWMVLDS